MSIDIMHALSIPPPPLDFVWPGFLAGTVGALIAPGGTGKSFFALEAAIAVACELDGGDLLGIQPQENGPVLYLAAEDPEAALLLRLYSLGQHFNRAIRLNISFNLQLEPMMGRRLDLMKEEHLRTVIDYAQGYRLIVFDTLSRVHGLDENSNSDMAQLVATLEHIALKTGAAVLFLHHVSKGSARWKQLDQQQAARGASALIDNVRWCGYLAQMSQEEGEYLSASGSTPIGERFRQFVRFGVSKQNYGQPMADRWYQRHSGGVLLPVQIMEIKNDRQKQKKNKYGAEI